MSLEASELHMETEKQSLKKSLNNWANLNNKNAEIGFTEALFTGVLVSSSIIDKFSTWLLAGSGATAALMIANLDKLSPVIGVTTFRQSIYILVISALFGFLAKYKSINCQIIFSTGEEIKKRILPVLKVHEEDEEKIESMAKEYEIEVNTKIDIEFVIKEYCRAFPKIMHSRLLRDFNQGINDRLAQGRKSANGLFWQGNYTVLQFFTFLGFLLLAVQNINAI